MAVVFDVFLFTPEYIEQIKRQEAKIDPSILDNFESEIGSIFCLNTVRKVPIHFFSIDEVLNLVESGYQVAEVTGYKDKLRQESEDIYPPSAAIKGKIELDDLFKGRFFVNSGNKKKKKSLPFKSREELGLLIASKALIKK